MTTVDNLRKAAKRWLKSLRDGDPEALARLVRAYPGAPKEPTLRDVAVPPDTPWPNRRAGDGRRAGPAQTSDGRCSRDAS